MAKKIYSIKEDSFIDEESESTFNYIENIKPAPQWKNFDHFWSVAVKNGTPIVKISVESYLKSIGAYNKPDKWINALINFGINFED